MGAYKPYTGATGKPAMTDSESPPTDETQTPEATSEPQEPKGSLGDEAVKAVKSETSKPDPIQKLKTELTPEQLAQVNSYVESVVGKAISGVQQKQEEKFNRMVAEQGLMTPDEVRQLVDNKIAEARNEAQAAANIDKWLLQNGIEPASEQATKLRDTYLEGKKDGTFTDRMLLSETGIKALIAVAGVAPSEKDSTKEEESFIPFEGTPIRVTEDTNSSKAPKSLAEMDALAAQAGRKALGMG